MKTKFFIALLYILVAGPAAWAQPPEQETTTAGEIIAKCLAAAGGEEKLGAVRTVVIKGSQGISILDPPPDKVTVFLKKPDRLKMVGDYQNTIFDGKAAFIDNGDEQTPLPEEGLKDLKFKVAVGLNAYSLLTWKARFDTAEFEGKKKYGPHEEYIIKFPKAMNEEDLFVHIDAKTLLIDRLVYLVPHPKAKKVKMVTRFRDWRDVGGLKMPYHTLFDMVGWSGQSTHFKAESIEINPEIEDDFLCESMIDFGYLVCGEDRIEGEARGSYFGFLQSNIRGKDLEKIGVNDGDLIKITVGDRSVEAIYVADIMASADKIKPEDIHFVHYPRSGYPRLMLLSRGVPAEELLTFETGDRVIVTRQGAEK